MKIERNQSKDIINIYFFFFLAWRKEHTPGGRRMDPGRNINIFIKKKKIVLSVPHATISISISI